MFFRILVFLLNGSLLLELKICL